MSVSNNPCNGAVITETLPNSTPFNKFSTYNSPNIYILALAPIAGQDLKTKCRSYPTIAATLGPSGMEINMGT